MRRRRITGNALIMRGRGAGQEGKQRGGTREEKCATLSSRKEDS